MNTDKEKILKNIAKNIQSLDFDIMNYPILTKDEVSMLEQARLTLFNILDINGFRLSYNYKLIQNGKEN